MIAFFRGLFIVLSLRKAEIMLPIRNASRLMLPLPFVAGLAALLWFSFPPGHLNNLSLRVSNGIVAFRSSEYTMKPIKLSVDLRETHRWLIHVTADLPVKPGETARLTTPLWIGEIHVPSGPVAYIAGLFFSAKGDKKLRWRRDPTAPFIYLVDVPAGVDTIHASFDAIISKLMTRRVMMLTWEMVLLHAADVSVKKASVQASVTIPHGWGHGSALRIAVSDDTVDGNGSKTTINYAPVTVERLADSPVLIGQHMSTVPITPDESHIMAVAADDAEHAIVPPETMAKLKRMISEVHSVFGNPPYTKYHFLFALSDVMVGRDGPGGYEHSDSCHCNQPLNYLGPQDIPDGPRDTIAHEVIHAWNGKYRRPVGNTPDNLTTPLDGTLLWVYEGLTQYYGVILSIRCGFTSPNITGARLASTAADMENQAGRVWRSLEDTGTSLPLGRGLGQSVGPLWNSWSRGPDYYAEGVLLWLDVDTLIRSKSGGRKTLDDFTRAFFSGRGAKPGGSVMEVVSYTGQQLEEALNDILPYDWATFFRERVQDVGSHVNVGGIERAGYKFVYADQPSDSQPDKDLATSYAIWYSVGLRLGKDGLIEDVRRYSSADDARLAPGQTVTRVGNEPFSQDVIAGVIHEMKGTNRSMSLTLKQDEETFVAEVKYNEGLRYPRLLRKQGQPDILASILAPTGDK